MAISELQDQMVMGLWRNYDLPAWRNAQLLLKDTTAQIVTNVVAVLLTLTLPRLFVFLKLLVRAIQAHRVRERRTQNGFSDDIPATEPSGSIQLEDLNSAGSRITSRLGESISNARSFIDAASRVAWINLGMDHIRFSIVGGGNLLANMLANLREETWTFAWVSAIAIVLFLVTVGQQIIAISTAFIVTDSAALIMSPFCGVWLSDYYYNFTLTDSIDPDYLSPPPKTFSNLPNERELRSISYAETCYDENARDGECSYFFKSAIPFEELHNSSCPFAQDTCLYGSSGAYSLDTGYLDSSVLGINEPVRCEFRMQSTCSPIRAVEPYVRIAPGKEAGSQDVSYYFGSFTKYPSDDYDPENFTIATVFRAFPTGKWRYIFYKREIDIMVFPPYKYPSRNPLDSYDEFRVEFKVPYAFTKIFLVKSTVFYSAPSDDPIFPAVLFKGFYSKFGPVYWNDLQRHTILACTNSMTIRHPRTGVLWYPYFSHDSELERPEWNEPSVLGSVTLLNLTYVLPDKFVGFFSTPKAQFGIYSREGVIYSLMRSEYWKTEVQRLFKIRLARLQMDIIGAAQGLGHDLPGAVDELAKRGQSEICRHIKFQSQGRQNISVAGLAGFLLLDFVIWLFTIEIDKGIAVLWFAKSYLVPAARDAGKFLGQVLLKTFQCTRTVLITLWDIYVNLRRFPRRTRR